MTIREEFTAHRLTEEAMADTKQLAERFSELFNEVERLVPTYPGNGREMALVRTHLQVACFYTNRALALHPKNTPMPSVDLEKAE
ncbi:MAG: hypothetical protein M3Q55_11235 [Acidobacteriota bacterium]|nr:hypothetical protein [Acidobacteriota bacterium]